ncbi:MAG: OPT/YSL family transporter, partial [Planctomycetes bacterium]|nr:OPT/YSL family transporter [Planctomycetota bacterium]
MSDPQVSSTLPENAYRELGPGERYTPMVPAEVTVPELSLRSILFGIAMNVVWAAAATYIALKVGQGIETAIPISILAVGLSGLLLRLGRRRSTILENINVLAISTTSGMVAGGTVFTMPAIYLLRLDEHLDLSGGMLFLHIFLVPLLGAMLGVIFLVPFRRYFVKEMHGKLPFPEATATNQILVTGQGGGAGALVLIYSFALSALYTLCTAGMKLWSEVFTTGKLIVSWKEAAPGAAPPLELVERSVATHAFAGDFWVGLAERTKAIFSLGTGAEFVGLGFIIGVRYASIIVAGSVLSFFVIVPLLAPLGLEGLQAINPMIQDDSAQAIFNGIPKNIGIGCIFTAGILSILKMGKVIVTALRESLGSLFRRRGSVAAAERTETDMSYGALAFVGLVTTVAITLYFRSFVLAGMDGAGTLTAVSVLLALGVAFIFITVSAWAIATISVTPISGMTVTTIIVTAVALLAFGLPKGAGGQLAVLLVGGVVATALSVAGTLVTEFKLGYWAGATPRRIQWSTIASAALASAVVTGTIMLLAETKGFDPDVSRDALQAPQANLMRSALDSFLGTGEVPWLPYGVGVAIALLMQLVGVSPLAFGLGMYLPMSLNTPILAGAIVAAAVKRGSGSDPRTQARTDKGIIIASGFIAGAAIVGVVLNGIRSWSATEPFLDAIDVPAAILRRGADPAAVGRVGNWLGLVA